MKHRPAGAAAAQVLRTLAELYRDGRNVACICRHCQHWATLSIQELIAFFGGTTTLRRLSDRLRCTRCGGRTAGSAPETPKPQVRLRASRVANSVHRPRHPPSDSLLTIGFGPVLTLAVTELYASYGIKVASKSKNWDYSELLDSFLNPNRTATIVPATPINVTTNPKIPE